MMNAIETRILNIPRGELFDYADLSVYGSYVLARKTIQKLIADGQVKKATSGLFCRPAEIRKLGITGIMPTKEEVANKYAESKDLAICVTEATALNLLGLSEQVPANTVYLTNGRSRLVKCNDGNVIRFQHTDDSAPFLIKNEQFKLIYLSLKYLNQTRRVLSL